MRHLLHGLAHRMLVSRFHCDHERQIVFGLTRQLQHRFQADALLGQNSGKSGDDPRPMRKPPLALPERVPGYDPRDIVITSRNFR